MSPKEKELLLKDICARLPYDIKCKIEMWKGCDVCTIYNINSIGYVEIVEYSDSNGVNIERIKPYLFPLSNMTLELRCKIQDLLPNNCDISFKNQRITFYNEGIIQLEQLEKIFNLFNMHHIDYRGLISMGLAIDATGLNIY